MVVLRGQIKINCTKYDCLSLCSLAWLCKVLQRRLIVPYGSWSIWESINGSQLYSRPLFHILKVITSNQSFPALLSRVLSCSGSLWLWCQGEPAQALRSKLLWFPRHVGRADAGDGHYCKGWVCCLCQPGSALHSRDQQWYLLSSSDQHISKTRIQRSTANVLFLLFGGWW